MFGLKKMSSTKITTVITLVRPKWVARRQRVTTSIKNQREQKCHKPFTKELTLNRISSKTVQLCN